VSRGRHVDYEAQVAKVCRKYGIQSRFYDARMHFLCWDVKILATPTYEQVFHAMGENFFHGYADAVLSTPNLEQLKEDWHDRKASLRIAATEDMRQHYMDARNGGTYLCYIRPALEKKYRVKVPPDKGWEVEFELYGNSGGWLSLERFEGISFRNITCSIDHEFMDLEDDAKHTYRRKLCAYLEEVSIMTRRDALDRELTYQLAFQMHLMVEQQQERRRA
jgi:hypothetical protein